MESTALRTASIATDVTDVMSIAEPVVRPLDFGLRVAERALRERIAPGMGHVWFARQLSWSCAAVALHAHINNRAVSVPQPSLIANAIEALVTKSALFCEDVHARHLGQAKLDPRRQDANRSHDHRDDWSFATLSAPTHYVQGAHRVAAAHALREEMGLGLARGTRYDTLALHQSGQDLADAFLDQAINATDTVGMVLARWICGDDILVCAPSTLHTKVGAFGITDDERDVLCRVLVLGDGDATLRRRNLASVLGGAAVFPDVEGKIVPAMFGAGFTEHANDILAARGYCALRDASSNVVRAMGNAMAQDGSIAFTKALQLWGVRESLDEARAAGAVFRMSAGHAAFRETGALYFAEALARASSPETALRRVLQRVPHIMTMGKTKVTQGPQFQTLHAPPSDGYDAVEPDPSSAGLASFHAFLRDLNA